MRNLLVVALFLNAVLVGIRCWREAPSADAGGDPLATDNGDVNGSGSRDLSDAVYLLSWLFQGGPAPVEIASCCLPPAGVALPATGQTGCYDEDGGSIDCEGEECSGQDGFYRAGCSSEGRFFDNGDGTVTDNCTGLMWQKETGNDGVRLPRCEALVYCEGLELAGHDDWRLPNVRELQSLVDYGREFPAIDPVFGVLSASYWTSTYGADNPDSAWHVQFSRGSLQTDYNYFDFHVRAVRSAP